MIDPFRSRAGWSAGPVDVDAAVPPRSTEPLRYVLGARLGRGAMGEVFEAVDPVLGRAVAVKVLAADAPPGADARLRREAALMAGLDHPGIVAVHDAGALPDGRPAYAMRLVRGTTLSDAVRSGAARGRAGLRALLSVADALAFAHAAGVVHRDVKPDNVLLGEHGEALLSDWGVARRLDEADPPGPAWGSDPARTALGGRVGTPAWMAPEVVAGASADRASDVYAVGRMIAAVLAGDVDVDGPPALPTDVPPDLRSLVARATAVDAAARYPDADALADDLRAWLDGRPVAAHVYGPAERAARWVGRNRVAVGVGVLALVALAVVSGVGFLRTRAALARATDAEVVATAALGQAETRLRTVLIDRALDALRASDVATAEVLATHALALRDDPLARGLVALVRGRGRPTLADQVPVVGRALALGRDGDVLLARDGDGVALWHRGADAPAWRHPIAAANAGFTDDGTVALLVDAATGDVALDAATGTPAAGGGSGLGWSLLGGTRLHWFDRATGLRGSSDPCLPTSRESSAALLPHGGGWLVGCGDGRLLRGGDGPVVEVPIEGVPGARVSALAVLPGGGIVVGTVDGDLVRLGADGPRAEVASGALLQVVASPDGGRLATLADDGAVIVVDAATLAPIARSAPGQTRLALTDDALSIAGTTWARWRLPDTPGRWVDGRGFSAVAISPTGLVAAAQAEGAIRLLQLPGLAATGTVRWQGEVVRALGFGGDGRLWGAGVGSPGIATIEPRDGAVAEIAPATPGRGFRVAAVLTDGTRLESDYVVPVARIRPGADPERLPFDAPLQDLAPSPSGAAAVALDAQGGVWRIAGAGAPEWLGRVEGGTVAAIDDGGAVWVGAGESVTRLRRGEALRFELPSRPSDVAVDARGGLVAVAGLDGHVTLLDGEGLVLASVPAHPGRVGAVAVSPDGRHVVSAGWDGVVQAWDVASLATPAATLVAEAEARTGLDLATLLDEPR